jgi:hypothetical protein
MIREDYIMRMIEQIGVLVRRILNQNVSEENVEADLEALTQQWIGLPSDMLLSLPVEHVHQLLVDSDRMVIEKSYLMGEIFRTKGLSADLIEAKIEYFEKALFFFGKCSKISNPELRRKIDQYVNELTAIIDGDPSLIVSNALDESMNLLSPQPSLERPSVSNRKQKRSGVVFWYAIAACFVIAAVYSFFGYDQIEIVDKSWKFDKNIAHASFKIVNNSNEYRLIKLKLSVGNYSNSTFSSGYTFLGAVEREYGIGPDSSKLFDERFNYTRNASGPNRIISIEVLSNKLAQVQ